jgi:hypothetical protein
MRIRSRRPQPRYALEPDAPAGIVWDRNGPVALADLHLSQDLVRDLEEYARDTEADPVDHPDEDLAERGATLASRLAAELRADVLFDGRVVAPRKD